MMMIVQNYYLNLSEIFTRILNLFVTESDGLLSLSEDIFLVCIILRNLHVSRRLRVTKLYLYSSYITSQKEKERLI